MSFSISSVSSVLLYTDSDVVVCDKPYGLLSEGEGKDSLPSLLKDYFASRNEPSDIFTVHRLDRTTRGVMVFARTAEAAASLSRAITEQKLKKEYLARVHGTPSEESAVLTDLLFYDRKRGKSFRVDRERKGVKQASLEYAVLARDADTSLLRIFLHTGRTHQIRVQLASRGLPIVGDRQYGAPNTQKPMALVSHRLSFPHPKTQIPMEFFSNVSPDDEVSK